MNSDVWIGVDLGKVSFVAAIAKGGAGPADWTALPVQEFAHSAEGVDAFVAWATENTKNMEQPQAVNKICLESTGSQGWRFWALLEERVGPVSMVNPLRPKRFAQTMGLRDKTDRVDACVLALFGRAMTPPPTVRLPEAVRRVQQANRLVVALKRDKVAYEARLAEWVEDAVVRRELKRMIGNVERRIAALEKHIDTLIAADDGLREDVARIESIPGVGRRTAVVLLGELGDLRAYTRTQIVGYAGLFPRHHQSGTSVHKRPRMAKGGGGQVRAALFMAAMAARRHNPTLKRYFERLCEQENKQPMVALGALMRKLLLLVRALLVHNTTYDPNFA